MKRNNIVFIGYPLDIDLNCDYEKRIALWKSDYDNLSCYEKVVDLGDIMHKTFGKEIDKSLELELCNRIMSLIDKDTVAIIDTFFSGHGLFEKYKALYKQLDMHLEKINNKEIKLFICEPLSWMGKMRYTEMHIEYNILMLIMGNRVFIYKDNESIRVCDINRHLTNFFKYVLDNIKSKKK